MNTCKIYSRKTYTQLIDHVTCILLIALLAFLPSVDLMQGTVSGKYIYFLCAICILMVLYFLRCIAKSPTNILFSYIDGLLFLWIGYILVNSWLKHIPLSNRFIEFLGLIFLYVFLRQIKPEKYSIILKAMVFGVTIQVAWGLLQLLGYLPSSHPLFKVTGSFFNPGPYAGFLVCAYPILLGAILFKKNFFSLIFKNQNQTMLWGITFALLFILILARSRASFLAISFISIMLLMKRYSILQWFRKQRFINRLALSISTFSLLCIVLFGLVKIKSNSANGRLLIWNISTNIVKEYPGTGVGFDRFNALYMEKQAEYFKEKSDSPDAMLAGDAKYCFNDLLQHTVENGIIGLVLFLGVLVCVVTITNKNYSNELWIAKAGVLGIVIFSLFSYPTQILSIKICFVSYLSGIAVYTQKHSLNLQSKYYSIYKVAFGLFVICFVTIGFKYLPAYYHAWKSWNSASQYSQSHHYTSSINECEIAWDLLKKNGDFLTYYGKILTIAGEHEQAINVLEQAVLYYPNIIVYTSLGDNHAAIGNISKAEQAYLHAWHMNPSRFYPKYLLAKLYDETGQQEKATSIANELLNKEVKVESTAVEEIKSEMRNILIKNEVQLE